jgi:hypothetical protein
MQHAHPRDGESGHTNELGTGIDDDYRETVTMVIITRSCCHVVLSSLLLCAAGSAMAADSGFYIGLDEGWVKYPNSAIREIGTTTLTGTGLNDTNFTWDFTAGYRFDHLPQPRSRVRGSG